MLYAMLPILSKPNNMLGSITGALYSLSVLVNFIAVKDTCQLLFKVKHVCFLMLLVSSCTWDAETLPQAFHVWGSKLKSGCIIYGSREESGVVKLTRFLKLSLWWCVYYICLCSIGQHTSADSTSVGWDVCYAVVRRTYKSHCNSHRCSTPLTET